MPRHHIRGIIGWGAAASVIAFAHPCHAASALGGIEGGLDFPTSEVAADATMTMGIGYAGTSVSYVFPPYSNRFYFLTGRVFPGLEVSARFTEVLGLHDPSIWLPNYVDRMLSVKWSPSLPAGWPSFAVGGMDLFSINEVNNLPGLAPGTTQYGASVYAVLGYGLGPLRWDVGYGEGKDYLKGPFSVLQYAFAKGLMGCLEYGSGRFNVGLSYVMESGLGFKVGYLQGRELGLASTYAFHL